MKNSGRRRLKWTYTPNPTPDTDGGQGLYVNRLSITVGDYGSAPMETGSQKELTIIEKAKIALHLVESVDETLEMLFGRQTKLQICDHLEMRFGLRITEIPDHPETLSNGLFSLFGSTSKQIELYILERFHNKLGIRFEPVENFKFADYFSKF